jgi:hypothetical protein
LHFSASGNVKLTDQTPIVRKTIASSFGFLHASLILENAFPDVLLSGKFIRNALSTAALHVHGAENLHVRILHDNDYCGKISLLVCFAFASSEPTNGMNLATRTDQPLSF